MRLSYQPAQRVESVNYWTILWSALAIYGAVSGRSYALHAPEIHRSYTSIILIGILSPPIGLILAYVFAGVDSTSNGWARYLWLEPIRLGGYRSFVRTLLTSFVMIGLGATVGSSIANLFSSAHWWVTIQIASWLTGESIALLLARFAFWGE